MKPLKTNKPKPQPKPIIKQKRVYPVDGKTIAGLLHGIHDHHPKTERIIYHEEDIIKLLTKLGYPKPKWEISLDLDKFKALRIKLDKPRAPRK